MLWTVTVVHSVKEPFTDWTEHKEQEQEQALRCWACMNGSPTQNKTCFSFLFQLYCWILLSLRIPSLSSDVSQTQEQSIVPARNLSPILSINVLTSFMDKISMLDKSGMPVVRVCRTYVAEAWVHLVFTLTSGRTAAV